MLKALGIVAPLTTQGTTLKKDINTYAVSVENGKFLNGKDKTFH
jgi:hypothetical protein